MKFKHLFLSALILVSVLSCKSISQMTVNDTRIRIKNYVNKEIVPLVKYDPYSAKIHFDRKMIYDKMLLLRSSLINDYQFPFRFYPYPGYSITYDMAKTGLQSFENLNWRNELLNQISNKLYPEATIGMIGEKNWELSSWYGISQYKYPKAGLQHGDYKVSCIMCVPFAYGTATRTYASDVVFVEFEINASINEGVKNESSISPQTKTDPHLQLEKLKKLFESGLITKEEYDKKKKEIIDGL